MEQPIDVPRLHSNPLLAALQLLGWFLFVPSAWQRYLASIDPALPPDFALSELSLAHWRRPLVYRMVLAGCVLLPLVVAAVLALGSWGLERWSDRVPAALVIGTATGLLFALTVSTATGIVVGVVACGSLALAWSQPGLLTVDMLLSVRFALAFGTIAAATLHITANLVQTNRRRATAENRLREMLRQIGGLVIGLAASVIVFFVAVETATTGTTARVSGAMGDTSMGILLGGVPALLLGLAVGWRTRNLRRGLMAGILLLVLLVVAFGDTGGRLGVALGGFQSLIVWSSAAVIVFVLLFVLPYLFVERIAGTWAGALAGAISTLAVYLVLGRFMVIIPVAANLAVAATLIALGATMRWWRPLLFYPVEAAWNTLLLRLDEERLRSGEQRRSLFRWNAALWDELQVLPFGELDDHLLLVMEHDPVEGQWALDRISRSRHRAAAVAAQIELDARRLERCTSIQQVAHAHQQLGPTVLAGPASAVLRSFAAHSRDVDAALLQISTYNQRLALGAVEEYLNQLFRELARSHEPYAGRFQPIAASWGQIVASHVAFLTEQAERAQELSNPYIVGVPLSRRQELFVGRTDISARIEELLRQPQHPPILLFGQRRMGKTSLLRHLRWLLPNRIAPLFVDLQGPVAQSGSHNSLLYNLAKAMVASAQEFGWKLAPLAREQLATDPFTVFDDWLVQVEATLVAQGCSTILLTLDEFEALDAALNDGRYSEQAVLGTLRHIVQHRPRFKLLLAGSHTLDEFRRWSSYLINAQVLHIAYLRPEEARQLIERPIEEFPLTYAPGASDRVLALTRGHPYLVQLLCSELVSLKNEQPPTLRRHATVMDVDAAVPETLARGSQFFADIELNQVSASGLELLRWLAQCDAHEGRTMPALAARFATSMDVGVEVDLLRRRELIEAVEGHFCFQVDLIRRWFARQAVTRA